MNRNDFLNMMENSVPVNRQMIGEVYELIDIFPYFQSAHLLLLKGLHDNSDVKFENQLKISAIHVGDREVLYWLLKKAPPETVISGNAEEPGSKSEIVTDTQQTVIESAKNSELMIDEIEKSSEEAQSGEKSGSHDQITGHTVMIATEPENTEPAGVMFLAEENTPVVEDKVFYMDPGFSIPEHSDLLELDLDDGNSIIPADGETNREYATQPDKDYTKKLQAELIDKFIIENPRIEPQKDKTPVPNEDISKPFVEDEGGLVTETLAKIYLFQGYYSKAINIYEKLSLKFPEKSSYFASQIEKVKEYIKK
jgi:hypothetical protein